ncbi:unnamed protein product [Parascedosporium putredinis]|uniref:Uncharacterized protein n=1 Tax=Parascedosporium putredinis TaxID=1442378 RepID=A0A9P1M7V6_9PEZI|nr:unnamed protein product [Parascedosporium putredinis]CAI7988078.1 unnamed protein product [Parascedosporium putredinis]
MASDAGDQVENDSAQSTTDQHVTEDPRPDSPEDRDSLELSEPAGIAKEGDESAESQLSEENDEYREHTASPGGEDDMAGKSILEILDSPAVHISAPEEAPMSPISESQAFPNPQDLDTLYPEVYEGDKDSYRSDSSNTGSSQYGDLGEMENTLKSLQEELQKQKFSSSHISNQAASMEQVIDTLEEDNARLLTKAEDLAAGQRSDESQLKYQELSDSIQKRKEKFVDQAAAAKSRKPPQRKFTIATTRIAFGRPLPEEERLLKSLSEEMGKLSPYLNVASADDDLCDRLAEGERPMHEPEIDPGRREAELLRRIDLYKRYIDKHKAERLPNNDAVVLNLGEQLQEALDKIGTLNERCTASEDQRDLAIAQVRDSETKIDLLKRKARHHETRQAEIQRSSTTSSGDPPDQGAQGLASHQSSHENESLDSRSSPGPDIMYENLADELEGLDGREDDRRTSILESGGFHNDASISDMLTLASVNAEKNQLARELEQCSLNNKMLKKQLHESHGEYQALSKELKALKDQMSKKEENTRATNTETELGSSESSDSADSRDAGPMMKKFCISRHSLEP